MGGQRKISHSRPLKIPSTDWPKILPLTSNRCPLQMAKIGARSGHSFSARQKKWVERMPGQSMQQFLKTESA